MSRRRWIVGVLLVAGGAGLVLNLQSCAAPLRLDPLARADRDPVVDEHVELVRRYAPFVYHAVHPSRGRQDLPAALDFDGDFNGENNWEHLPRYELLPTLYYCALQTETHWFLTWHIFHPRDWSVLELGVHMTHEGDGENLQVVVDKSSGRVVLLFTQAHYCGGVYTAPDAGFGPASQPLRGALVLVDGDGRPDPDGTHPAVFVESGGHGIYGLADAPFELGGDGSVPDADVRVFRPARPGERVDEPPLSSTEPVPYRLESTPALLLEGLVDGTLVGEGRLLDGTVRYEDERIRLDLPRYHEADRYSGPFGPDRGISPFAVDFDFDEGTLGALFFDPARRYAECLIVPQPWSTGLVDDPFTRR